VNAKWRQQFGEHVEVAVLSPHREIVGDGGRGDDRVHRSGTPSGSPRFASDPAKPLGGILVISSARSVLRLKETRISVPLSLADSRAFPPLQTRRCRVNKVKYPGQS
jgi:hypothetical protein